MENRNVIYHKKLYILQKISLKTLETVFEIRFVVHVFEVAK